MIKVGMVSLGCPKNQVDGEILLGFLNSDEFIITNDASKADAVIINTCGFIEAAKAESIENILEFCGLKKSAGLKSVVVTGCLAERYKDEIMKEIPEVDVVLGIGENAKIAQMIKKSVLQKEKNSLFSDKYNLPLEGERVLTTPPYTAYLKIAEGCDNLCTYCAIPMIRGGFRSRKMEDILTEAQSLASRGVKEIVLVAQDTSRYGEDLYGKSRLADLLRELAKIEELVWIRVLYCYPERIDDELLAVFASEKKLVKYIDLPLQHASESVLKRMNRHGNGESLKALIAKIRAQVPGVVIRTSLIAGFPGETPEDFLELCDFVKEIRFDRMGCFAYSKEEDTPAAKLPEQIPEEEKQKRAGIIMEMQQNIAYDMAGARIGQSYDVLVEGFDDENGVYYGRAYFDAPEIDFKIYFTAEKKLAAGDFVPVKILAQDGLDLSGKMEEGR